LWALGELKDERAVQPLITALGDDDKNVRFAAASAIGNINDLHVADALLESLSDDDAHVRTASAMSLTQLRDSRAVDALIACLSDNEAEVRSKSAEGLYQLGNARAIKPLIDAGYNDEARKLKFDLLAKAAKTADKISEQLAEIKIKQELGEISKEDIEVLNKSETSLREVEEVVQTAGDQQLLEKIKKIIEEVINVRPSIHTIIQGDYITGTQIKDSVLNRSPINLNNAEENSFTICPYCGKDLNLPKTPQFCPFCREKLMMAQSREVGEENLGILFDVAISYASEDLEFVEKYAQLLQKNDVKVFFDRTNQHVLWGNDLNQGLTDIYEKQSRFVVAFISKHYLNKHWTNQEMVMSQINAMQNNRDYFLPIKLDDNDLPGLAPTTVYLEAKKLSEWDLVNITLQKLKQ